MGARGPKPAADGRIFKGTGLRISPEAFAWAQSQARKVRPSGRPIGMALFVGQLIEEAYAGATTVSEND